MNASSAAGWFGKLSMLGDFASRRLEPALVQRLDEWLSGGIQSSQRQLGGDWLAAYLAAPLWRFAWAPGVVDTQWWFGVLMPSSDKVGRYFPLVVAHARAAPPAERFALDHLELWWAHMADTALRSLAEGAQLEQFEHELEQAPPWPRPPQPAVLQRSSGPACERFTAERAICLETFAHGLAAGTLLEQLHGHSLWSAHRAPSQALSCSIVRGLPVQESFSALLTGQL